MKNTVPEFAVVGHPNEGKSSVLSTLAEDDSVRISPMPGETRECQTFPVIIDGVEIIRFVDTPGFQNPQKTLRWMQEYEGDDTKLIHHFLEAHQDNSDFHDDCSLLQPLVRGAGIIFVVDGSRPLRNMDKAEMEILRLTGCPRMAIINCKDDETAWLGKWQQEFRKHFNAIRLFNSCRATYRERIALLESLKSIDQELQPALDTVVTAFKEDWRSRNRQVAEYLLDFLEKGLGYSRSVSVASETDDVAVREKLFREYEKYLRKLEQKCQVRIRSLYKHNIFTVELPEHSILQEDLFADKTWEFLGLSSSQLILAGAMGGAVVGAGLDVAAAGISFGIFSAIGGIVGAAGTALKGKEYLTDKRLLGIRLQNEQLQVGPVKNIQLLFVLLDRQLLFYRHVINWSHGRRDYDTMTTGENIAFTANWEKADRDICSRFFKNLQSEDTTGQQESRATFSSLLERVLVKISSDDF